MMLNLLWMCIFKIKHPDSNPDFLPGADLQICQTKGPTCCSKKMEDRYQVAARSNMESGLQVVSSQLKRLIIQNAAIFQEAFDLVLRHGRNSTLTMLKSEFPGLGSGAQGSVVQLFRDMSLYTLGSDSTVDNMVSVFLSKLFPLTHRRLLGGSAASVKEECLRGAWKDSGAFGSYPKLIMTRLSRSLLATRVFLQALNLGIEVVNTTHHLRPSRDCSRALLRLWYCPHCQGVLGPPPCRGFCQAVMQSCLGGAAEVQPHWRRYIDGLGKLAGGMRGEQDMEAVVLRLPAMIKLALKHAVSTRSHLSTLLLQMVAVSEKRWRAQSRGGGADGWGDEDEEGFQSGDCDDEDECMGVSGLGPPLRRKRLRIFADLSDNLAMDDFAFQEQLLTPRLATGGVGGVSSPAASLKRSCLVSVHSVMVALLLVCHH
uniref:Glypican-3 n=1 Tax=Oryzias melastigma TaxID=30732 RepID=A0A3B3C9H6_ORYME